MVWIETHASGSVTIASTLENVRGLVNEVPISGKMFPGVDSVEPSGHMRWRFRLAPRKTLGTSFTGEYVAEYRPDGDGALAWTTVEGNVKTNGRWLVAGRDGAVVVRLEITSSLDAPVPRLLKKPAELFADKETRDGVAAQLEALKKRAES